MKIEPHTMAAHQLHFLPSLHYFHKMARAEVFVVADDVQYTTHSLMNRVRVKTTAGPCWLTVPVRTTGRGRQKLNTVRLAGDPGWRHKHWRTITLNYRNAPYFDMYVDVFADFFRQEWQTLWQLNLAGLTLLRDLLGLNNRMVLSSTLAVEGRGTGRIIALMQKLGCSKYVVEAAARRHLDESAFALSGMSVAYFSYTPPVYHQQFGAFLADLSVLDVLFNEGESARQLLYGNERAGE